MARFESSVFIALTDDPPYAEDFVGKRADVVVSKENVGVDLAIMSLCDGGILSASSLSWWGAYFANDRQGRGPFVAPKYWLGHREEQWRRLGREEEQLDSESKIQTSFLDYV